MRWRHTRAANAMARARNATRPSGDGNAIASVGHAGVNGGSPMHERTVRMFYCDFCKKRGQSSYHMKRHEAHCTGNPARVCGVCGAGPSMVANLVVAARDGINVLREAADGCPACMLAGVRALQRELGKPELDEHGHLLNPLPDSLSMWKYKDESESYWAQRNSEERREAVYYGG
jgi:hypothetical protein